MAWWMAVPAALQVAGSIGNMLGQQSQADWIRKQAAENVRRMRLQHEATLGETRTRGGASGFEYDAAGKPGDSSLQTYLAQMSQEFRRQEDWIKKTADAEAGAMDKSSIFGALTGIGSGIFSYGQSMNWFR